VALNRTAAAAELGRTSTMNSAEEGSGRTNASGSGKTPATTTPAPNTNPAVGDFEQVNPLRAAALNRRRVAADVSSTTATATNTQGMTTPVSSTARSESMNSTLQRSRNELTPVSAASSLDGTTDNAPGSAQPGSAQSRLATFHRSRSLHQQDNAANTPGFTRTSTTDANTSGSAASSSSSKKPSTMQRLFLDENGRRAQNALVTDDVVDSTTTNSPVRRGTLNKPPMTNPRASMVNALNATAYPNESNSSMPPKQNTVAAVPQYTGPQYVIPYQIIRGNGTIAKPLPDNHSTGKIIPFGTKISVYLRRMLPDNETVWFKSSEGWIQEKVLLSSWQDERPTHAGPDTQNRILSPVLPGQPIGVKIVNTRFEEIDEDALVRPSNAFQSSNTRGSMTGRTSSWVAFRPSMEKEEFQTRFTMDILCRDHAIIQLSRTFSELLTLRATLLNFPDKIIRDRAKKALTGGGGGGGEGEFVTMHDGVEELLTDVNMLLSLIEEVEQWLGKLLSTIQIERCKCKALVEFFTPRREDIELMEVSLMASGGMRGCWPEEVPSFIQ
jgi:hypothetical protein